MTEKRGSLYLVTGAIIGLIVGAILSSWILPVRYIDTAPQTLRESDRKEYRILVAEAYLVEGDTNRALTRLNLLNEENQAELIIAQAQNMLSSGGNQNQARALALLAAAVKEPSIHITPLAPQSASAGSTSVANSATKTTPTKQVTRTPSYTSTPRPTSTPQATPGAPFELIEQRDVCDSLSDTPLLQITVYDAANHPVSGVRIEISQPNGGVEAFYTGMYPEINSGYADFEMLPGMVYAIRVGEEGQLISDLAIPDCKSDGEENGYGNLSLSFRQP